MSFIRLAIRYVSTVLVVSVLSPSHATVQTKMPDFYYEPGLHPFRGTIAANVNENIDTFNGGLNITHTDLVVPGNGGLDIRIQRAYNTNSVYDPFPSDTTSLPFPTRLVKRNPYGLGWTMHFGRLIGLQNGLLCVNGTEDNLDNGMLELPDGSRQILFRNSTSYSSYYITKELWVASCGSGGMVVVSPDGIKYTMNQVLSAIDVSGQTEYVWYTTRIEDPNGNWIAISYDTGANSGLEPVFKEITSSDGRSVQFAYTDRTDSARVRLSTITSNGQTWTYFYTQIADDIGGHYHLAQVSGPGGFNWQYNYNPKGATSNPGNRLLYQLIYPYGGIAEYTYDFECLNSKPDVPCQPGGTFYSQVIKSKRNYENGQARGLWSYSYSPSTSEDVTTVTFPGGRYVFRHFGSKTYLGGATIPGKSIWRVGLLKEKETYNGSTLVKRERFTWEPLNQISNEKYIRPPHLEYSDYATFAPVLTKKEIILDGTSYVSTYSNFDTSFNPQTIVESGQATRTINLTYFPRIAGQNIVRRVKDEVLQGEPTAKNIYRTYDAKANLLQITRRGVTESYTYHDTGDRQTRTDARNNIWTYFNYHRGVPANEQHPQGVKITRTINDTGTIASETNGRGYTTIYSYDGMNRLVSAKRPAGATVAVNWNVSGLRTTGRTVTRGAYVQTTNFDPFGRTASVNSNGIIKNYRYNDLGHVIFESYPSSTLGDTFATDVLGRVRSVAHGDGTSRSHAFLSGNQMQVTNERNRTTLFTYRSFGDPEDSEERELMQIDAPEGVVTTFARDVIGLPTAISQGGITRSYTYNASNFLVSETNPEIGTTTYGRDALGNMTSRAVGGSAATTFTYDGLNRLTGINYPGATPDATLTYDGNNNVVAAANGATSWSYSYDPNDNLISESLAINGRTLTATHGYNGLDYLASTTYPSGQVVAYNPDALGRATTVSPYIKNAIGYHPSGVPSDFTYDNGRRTTVDFNARHWVSKIASFNSSAYVTNLSYGYDGAGNVTTITDALNSSSSRSLGYDGLDRLTVANGVWGAGSFEYDQAGNITKQKLGSFSLSYFYSNNRLASASGSKAYTFGYDIYGNVSSNSYYNFLYDDASRLVSATASGGAVVGTYTYDAHNMRSRVQQDGKDTYVFYAKDGRLLGEYDADGRYKEYAYLGTRLVAMRGVSPGNQSPVANAGPDQTIGEAQPVTLNGGASSDPDGSIARYSWQQTAGPAVSLNDSSSITPSFVAPLVRSNTTLTFSLYVNDGDFGTASDSVSLFVQNTSDDDDKDGLSDLWEAQYFGSLAYGPNDDPDGDGLSNAQENLEGTNPTVAAPAPARITVVEARGGISSNTISWQPVTSASSYNIYWSTSPGVTKANGTRISGVRTPYRHAGLINGTRYYYVVTAQNNSGESPESPEVSAMPSIAPLIPILELLLND